MMVLGKEDMKYFLLDWKTSTRDKQCKMKRMPLRSIFLFHNHYIQFEIYWKSSLINKTDKKMIQKFEKQSQVDKKYMLKHQSRQNIYLLHNVGILKIQKFCYTYPKDIQYKMKLKFRFGIYQLSKPSKLQM
jgi:hypothetical protein